MADANPRCPVAGCGAPMIFCGIGPAAEPFCKFEDAHKYDSAQKPISAGSMAPMLTISLKNTTLTGGFQGVYRAAPAPCLGPMHRPQPVSPVHIIVPGVPAGIPLFSRPTGAPSPTYAQYVSDGARMFFHMFDGTDPGLQYPLEGWTA